MEIKGFWQCIAANKQQACGLAAAASCGMVAACVFFVCKLVLLLLVAATLRLLVAATLRLLVAATLQLIVCCNLAACAFFVCKLVQFAIYATFTCITYYHFEICPSIYIHSCAPSHYFPLLEVIGGRLVQWLGHQISNQGVPGSSLGRCAICCGLEQVTFTPILVLLKPRKRWTHDRLG